MTSEDNTAKRGVLVAAENGPAIEFDETGLILNLSDVVVTDIARRIGGRGAAASPAVSAPGPAALAADERLDAALLGDVDAWDVARRGDWLWFTARLPGASGARRYARHVAGGGIVAETAGPVFGILGIGGGRHATTWPGAPRFAAHAVACPPPADGEPDRPVITLRNRSGETELADTLLARRHEAYRALPLVVTGHALLPPGPLPAPDATLAEVATALDRMEALAEDLGKPARLLAVRLELGQDQAPADAAGFHADALALMQTLSDAVTRRGIGAPRFLAVTDCGAWWQHDADANRPALEGQHLLMLRPGSHDLMVAAPGYMFAQDTLGQPTEEAAADRAEMEAWALDAALARQSWTCPLLYLAERDGEAIRATFKSDSPLVLDPADPFGAGPDHGFALSGTDARIARVEVAPDDPGAVLIHTDRPVQRASNGAVPRLDYAIGGAPRDPGAGVFFAPACGALRDGWAQTSRTGRTLHRWALPGSAEIH